MNDNDRTIIGLDPSLRHTGVARWREGRLSTMTIHTTDEFITEARFRYITGRVFPLLTHRTFVVLEAPFVSSNSKTSMMLAGLHYIIRYGLWVRRVPYGIVTPAELKKVATGMGGGPAADKAAMVAMAEATFTNLHMGTWNRPTFDVDGSSHEADALWCLAMGLHHVGVSTAPGGAMEPGLDHEQLTRVRNVAHDWPDIEWQQWEEPE